MDDSVNSCEIELSVVGCLLLWYDELKHRITEISEDDFYYPEGKAIFAAIRNNFEKGVENVDIALISSLLPDGLKGFLCEAASYPSTSVYFGEYLMRLKELSASRRIKNRLSSLVASQNPINIHDLQSIVDSESDNVFIKSYIDKSKATLQDFIDNVGLPKQRIKLGFPTLDKVIGGLRIPSVMMLGAYPSVGKTAFALNVASNQDKPVVFFSLEMSSEMIYERLTSANKKIDYNLFSAQKFTSVQKREISQMCTELKNNQFYVFDDIYDVEGHSAVIANIKPCLVIVDYIQKVRTSKKTDNRRSEIDYISGMYKQIAKHNKCAIMLLSQISRVDRNEPNMSSLKESGALEADGDYVGILHRPYVTNKDNPEITPEQAYILIDKNKFGNTGKLELYFKGEYQRFYETKLDSENPFV